MEASDIRTRFLDFFAAHGHVVVPSSSLIPDDPSVLLTTAGMQQFKPYYTGERDPLRDFGSKDTASVQKSFRTSDIESVGDESHLTFFEMLGNFSFGGYFKEQAIRLAYDFFEAVKLPLQYVTVFEGDADVPADVESEAIWRKLGVTDIRRAGRADNFWGPTGSQGPCGPTTEIYVSDTEIWNIVFNEYYCRPDRTLEQLKQNGVDTGMGLERLAMVLQGKPTLFDTDLFKPYLELLPGEVTAPRQRIIVDHLRGAAFLIADGVRPSNKEAGYVLRRLLRRVMVYEYLYRLPSHVADAILHGVAHDYGQSYPELLEKADAIREEFRSEQERFRKTLARGVSQLKQRSATTPVTPAEAFHLYETFGLPFEVIKELGDANTRTLTREAFDAEFAKHQEISRAGQEKKFGGHGLILDTGELKAANEEELKKVTRLHTATHLLNSALHAVLGNAVVQNGSDITVERTRFDFSFPRKLTADEIQRIEGLVNAMITKDYRLTIQELPLEEAKRSGALYLERSRYPDPVTVYTVGNDQGVLSKELCGGPHVERTGEIGRFRIIKEEASSAGVRRIRAIVAP